MTADSRIVPVWKSAGLIAPDPWSPWFAKAEQASDALKNVRRRPDGTRKSRFALAS